MLVGGQQPPVKAVKPKAATRKLDKAIRDGKPVGPQPPVKAVKPKATRKLVTALSANVAANRKSISSSEDAESEKCNAVLCVVIQKVS